MEREAILYDKLPQGKVRCNVCQWRCAILPGKKGVCHMRQNKEGVLYTLNYALASSAAADPIEKKPLFHFFPKTRAFSLGGWGCNFHCQHCQNWQISCTDAIGSSETIRPSEAVELAQKYHCQGIAWTYNEPSIWFEYTLDGAKLAKQKGLYTVYVTNGFLTSEALDAIGPWLDAWRVDVKGFSDSLYQKLARVSGWRGILEVAERARKKWNMHVEVVTNIIPGLNDDEAQLYGIAQWIKEALGELTPWHVTRFYPQHKLDHISPTPVSTLERAYQIGKEAGLRFVYTGNIAGHALENTTCYSCDRIVVKRTGYEIEVVGVDSQGRCQFCGADLNIRR